MRASLLFPPATDPRAPHLSLASLAAFLRPAGVRTTVRDLDLEGLLAMLTPERLGQAVADVRECHDTASRDDRAGWKEKLEQADAVVPEVERALGALRDPVAFYDPNRHHAARACLSAALDLVSAGTGRVRYRISNPAYDVDGVDPTKLRDLLAVTADSRSNLFDDLFRTSVLPELARDAPDVVGISILNRQQIVPGLALARMVRAAGHFVVIGGTVYAKFVPQLLARPAFFDAFCDAVVPYEGETALLALVEHLAGGGGPRDLAGIPNLVYRGSDGRPRETATHLENVSTLPTPDFEGHRLAEYLAPAVVLPILTGKGCYFNRCKFCDIPYINRISDRPYRVRSPEQVAADVAALHARHGARHFEITDEALSPRLLGLLGDALADHSAIEPRFVGYARLEPAFTAEACERIFAMGMRKLFFGLESGSQATLDHMDKGARLAVAPRVLKNCARAGIAFHIFSIIGFPEETEARARETLAFFLDNSGVVDAPQHSFDIHPFGLDLRTEYGEQAERFGVLVDAVELSSQDFAISVDRWRNTRGLDGEDVERLLEEFAATLRLRFAGWRYYPEQQWPGYEEYAVLYGDHYQRRPFAYRLALPPAGDPTAFGLAWADGIRFVPAGSSYQVVSRSGSAVVPRGLLQLLARPTEEATVDELLGSLAAGVHQRPGASPASLLAQIRRGIDSLLACRALWLQPQRDHAGTPAERPASVASR